MSPQGRCKRFPRVENYNREPSNHLCILFHLPLARRSNMQNTLSRSLFSKQFGKLARPDTLGTIETRRSSNELCPSKGGEKGFQDMEKGLNST